LVSLGLFVPQVGIDFGRLLTELFNQTFLGELGLITDNGNLGFIVLL